MTGLSAKLQYKRESIFSGVSKMDALNCIGIELIIEGLRPKLFEILSDNLLEPSTFCEKEVAPANISIEILDVFDDSRTHDGISIVRTINARVGSTKYVYYILKMRDFYCLPAFLAPTLPRTPGYLSLELENQMRHYYIFIKQVRISKGYLRVLFTILMSPFYARQ